MDYFGDGTKFGVNIEYFNETVPLGNAGALFQLKDKLTEDFLLLNADAIFDVDFRRFVAYHREKNARVTLFTHPNNHPYDSGLNDCEPAVCFAQQVNGFGNPNDVFIGISTSGNSKNVMYAATVARAKGMKVIGLTGSQESKLSAFADVCVKVPNTETYMVQECHLPIYHCWCLMLEECFFG